MCKDRRSEQKIIENGCFTNSLATNVFVDAAENELRHEPQEAIVRASPLVIKPTRAGPRCWSLQKACPGNYGRRLRSESDAREEEEAGFAGLWLRRGREAREAGEARFIRFRLRRRPTEGSAGHSAHFLCWLKSFNDQIFSTCVQRIARTASDTKYSMIAWLGKIVLFWYNACQMQYELWSVLW